VIVVLIAVGAYIFTKDVEVDGVDASSPIQIQNLSTAKSVLQFAAGSKVGFPSLLVLKFGYKVPPREEMNYWQHLGGQTLGTVSFGCKWKGPKSFQLIRVTEIYIAARENLDKLGRDEATRRVNLGIGYCLARSVAGLPQSQEEINNFTKKISDLVSAKPIIIFK